MKNSDRLNRYALQIDYVEDEGFVASFKELGRSATGYGPTREEAIQDLIAAVEDLVEVSGESLPEPKVAPAWTTYSGRVTLRIARSLHCQLDQLAEEEGVSLNSLLSDLLQAGATARLAGRCTVVPDPPVRNWSFDPNVIPVAQSIFVGFSEGMSQPVYERATEPAQTQPKRHYELCREASA